MSTTRFDISKNDQEEVWIWAVAFPYTTFGESPKFDTKLNMKK